MISEIKIIKRNKTDNTRFSILIPTWNNLDYLKLCIDSVKKNSHFQHQLIVMINEGRDGTLEWVENQRDIDYVYANKNLGICWGLNACRSLIGASYVVYANDDMYFLPDWDLFLYDEIKRIASPYFMLSSTMIEHSGNNNCCIIADYGDSVDNFRENDLLQDFKSLKKDNWSGSSWPPNIVSLQTWDLVGGMSTEFNPGMYSDPDLSMKLWQLGVRTFIGVGNSLVYHFGCKSTKRVKKNKGKYQFLRKWKIPSSLFFSDFLKRGEPAVDKLPEVHIDVFQRITMLFKLFISIFK